MSPASACPDCTAPLEVRHHEGVELDACPAGHGLWLDRGELHAVLVSERSDQPRGEEDAARAAAVRDGMSAVVRDATMRPGRTCPICGSVMLVREYPGSGVAMDECSHHGIWLDAGELERLEAFAEAMRRQVSAGAGGDAAGATGGGVSGLALPPSLLASLRTGLGVLPPR